jgi:hypothetical protein
VLIAACEPHGFAFYGRPTGALAGPAQVELGVVPRSTAIADGDGDTIPDLVTVGDLAGGGVAISVVRGMADGSFAAPVVGAPLALAFDPRGVDVGEFTGDPTTPDLLLSDPDVAGALALLPDLATVAAVPLTISARPQSLVVADADVDGDQDVLVGSSDDDSLLTIVGEPPLFIDQRLTELDGVRPIWMAAADLDYDGRTEILVVDPQHDHLLALRADDAGMLIGAGVLPVGEGASVVRTGDVDADGIDDVLLGRFAARELVVWRATSVP